ncbi:MAG: hypothetical protein FJX74_04610 [Armatimonadetes bacterium]|nr:hypothetical protein [Armatimonadota bacterium]
MTYWLRIRLEADEVFAEASVDGDFWDVIHSYPRAGFPGEPSVIRLGKNGPGGQAVDHPTMDRPGTCAIRELRVYTG